MKDNFTLPEIRAAFEAWWDLEEAAPTVEIDGTVYPIRWLVGQLWHNTDYTPSALAYDIRQGTMWDEQGMPIREEGGTITFAQAALATREYLLREELWETYPNRKPWPAEESAP